MTIPIPKGWKASVDYSSIRRTVILSGSRYELYTGELPNLPPETACWFVRLKGRVIASGICDDILIGMAQAEQAASNWAQREWRVYG